MEKKYLIVTFGLTNLLVAFSLFVSIYLLTQYRILNVPKIEKSSIDLNQLTSRWNITQTNKTQQKEILQTNITNRISVLATSVGYKNMAIIHIDGKRKIVKEGDNLDGIKVVRIAKDYVEFMAGEHRERIKLGYLPQQQPQASPSIPINNLPPLENILPPQTKGVNTISKSELERLTADPGIMFTQIRLIPFVEDGRTKGFRFDWIADGSLFQKMGINVGDILVSINNQPINSGEDAFRILQIIRNERSFKIAIIRNGQPMELSYTVN